MYRLFKKKIKRGSSIGPVLKKYRKEGRQLPHHIKKKKKKTQKEIEKTKQEKEEKKNIKEKRKKKIKRGPSIAPH